MPTSQSNANNSTAIFAVSIRINHGCVDNTRAKNELYLIACEPSIHYWCRRYYIPGYDYEDLLQEMRMQIWRKLDRYDPEKATIITWAKPVIVNKLIELLRKQTLKKRWNGQTTCEIPENMTDNSQNPINLLYLMDLAQEKGLKLEEIL